MTKKQEAAYKHQWYLDHREERLKYQRDKYVPRPKRTPEQIAQSRKKGGRTLKRRWKTYSPAKRRKISSGLRKGQATQQQRAKNRIIEKGWEILKRRLRGVAPTQIYTETKSSSNFVNDVLRKFEVPKGKQGFLFSRGHAFTRGQGTQIRLSLGLNDSAFGELIDIQRETAKERARRIDSWYTKPKNKLLVSEARKCEELLYRVASTFLATEKSGSDSYNRSAVLLALFPRLKTEYQLLLGALPDLRICMKSGEPVDEQSIARFFLGKAFDESRLNALVHWLPDLMPSLLEHRVLIAGNAKLHHVAKVLLSTSTKTPLTGSSGVTPGIVKLALEAKTKLENPKRMRELFRYHFPKESARIGLLSATSTNLGGRPPGSMKRTDLRNEMCAISELLGWQQKEIAEDISSKSKDPVKSTFDYFSHHKNEIRAAMTRLQSFAPTDLKTRYDEVRLELLKVLASS
jgi:hypothetical protein